jgi:uncharacterized membrane protein HdeD (DUF308 family)
MWYEMATWKKVLTVLLTIIGILAIVVGVIYIAEPAKSIPHFFPAYKAKSHFHATKHGAAALVVGVVLLIVAVILALSSRNTYE